MTTSPILSSGGRPRPEVLLADADALGTLAAVRSFGRSAIPVSLLSHRRDALACWSRHAGRVLTCPSVGADPMGFLDWLLARGEHEPGRVLAATSDDTAWLFARYRERLGRDFQLYLPPVESIYPLLNKWRLHLVCVALGIDTPKTWAPQSAADVSRLARSARFPLVIKPRTQAFLVPHQKGQLAQRADELASSYRAFVAGTRHAPMLLEYDREVSAPIVQSFVRDGADRIYSVAGFIDETGEQLVAEASRKVFQWPPHLGVGLCFESAPLEDGAVADLKHLCRHVGYFGAFEAEFVEANGRRQLIDFNPRFYGQLALAVARGLDLPLLVYLAATGQHRALTDALEQARRRPPASPQRYCHRIELNAALGLLALAERTDATDRARWVAWSAHHSLAVDPILDRHDPLPAAVGVLAAVTRFAVHPRSAWRAAHVGCSPETSLPMARPAQAGKKASAGRPAFDSARPSL